MNEPRIKNEINGSYTLEFEFSYLDRDKVNNNVLIRADGQYFIFSRINKFRNDSLTLSAFCEHVSYLLIGTYEFTRDDILEGTASQLMTQAIRGTRFNIRGAYTSNSAIYNSETDNIRNRLLEIADLFRGELIFDNFEIELVQRLGDFNTQTIQLGTNLLGVSEEIDYINNERSYEVDLVDLARLTGYESEQPIQLGDTVRITDEQLAINAYERVISIEYNPFNKSLPLITVGTYVRTFTEYFQEELNREEEEEELRDILLSRFFIGINNVLDDLSDENNSIESYLLGELRLPIASGSVTTVVKNQLTGLDIQFTSEADRFNKYVVHITRENNRSQIQVVNFSDLSTSGLLSKTYPETDIESLTLILSELTLDDLRTRLQGIREQEGQEDIPEEDLLEYPEFYTYGVRLTVDDSSRASDYLYRFDIGENNVLGQLSNEFLNVRNYIEGVNNYVIPTAEFRLPKLPNEMQTVTQRFETLRGLFVELLEDVALMNYNFTFINSQLLETGQLVTEEYPWSEANGSQSNNRLITRAFSEGFTFVIHERPFEDYRNDPTLYFTTVFAAFGIHVVKDIQRNDPLSLFKRFQVGNFDLINSLSNQYDNVVRRFSTNGVFDVPTNEFEITQRQIGLFVEQQLTNVGGYLTLIDQRINNDVVVNGEIIPYGPDVELFNYTATYEKRGIIVISSDIPFEQLTGANLLENLRGAFGVTITLNEQPPKPSDYLSEFRIGQIDFLPNAVDVRNELNNANTNNDDFLPSYIYRFREGQTETGLFLALAEQYQNYHIIIYNSYQVVGETNITSGTYGYESVRDSAPTFEYPYPGELEGITIAISSVQYRDDITAEELNQSIVAAFGITLAEAQAPDTPTETMYFKEVGNGTLETDMIFLLANGPYRNPLSIVYSLNNTKTNEISTNQYNVRCYPYYDSSVAGFTQIRVVSEVADPDVTVSVIGIFDNADSQGPR